MILSNLLPIGCALQYEAKINNFITLHTNQNLCDLKLLEDKWSSIRLISGWLGKFCDATTQMSTICQPMSSHIHATVSFIVFRNIFVNHFELYHLALICTFRMAFLLHIISQAITIISLTNPLSISGLHICLYHFWLCLAYIPAVFNPRITYEGLKLNFANDPVLLADLNKSKLHLYEYYNKYYAISPVPFKDISNVHPKPSGTSALDFTACYKLIIPDSINELEEYLKIKQKDFKKCDLLRW